SRSLSPTIELTCGTGTRWRRRNRPISPSTPPFSWAPPTPAGSWHSLSYALREALAAGRQAHVEQLHLGQVHADGAEVDLAFVTEHVALGDHHLGQRHRLADPNLADVAAHRRV